MKEGWRIQSYQLGFPKILRNATWNSSVPQQSTCTATSIIRRALAISVRFRTVEVADIVDSGQIEDHEVFGKLILAYLDNYTCEQLNTLLSCFVVSEPVYALIDQICSNLTFHRRRHSHAVTQYA